MYNNGSYETPFSGVAFKPKSIAKSCSISNNEDLSSKNAKLLILLSRLNSVTGTIRNNNVDEDC